MIKYAELFAGVGGFRLGIEQTERGWWCSKNEGQPEGVALGDLGGRRGELPDRSGKRLFSCVYSSEIDKHCCAVYRHIWRDGDELQEGDIREQDTSTIPSIDFLTAGFPCQSFSVAGRLGGFQDTRGTLFFEVARFLADKRPRHFLLENVKNLVGHDSGKTFQTILGVLASVGYRVEWEVLNSTCWVPQNRERVFIVGHLRGECGRAVFPLREDAELHTEPSGQGAVANCLDSNYWKGWLDKCQRTMVCQAGHRTKGKPRFYDGEIPAMTQDYGTGGQNVPIVGKVGGGGFCDNRICGDTAPTLMGCANTNGHQSGISQRNPIVRDASTCIDANYAKGDWPGSKRDRTLVPVALDRTRFRRLTPTECERLQGWSDDHTLLGLYRASDLPKSKRNGSEYELDVVSDTQRYKMAGNGVTADVVREVVKKMLQVGCLS